jgi:hypothetical protein
MPATAEFVSGIASGGDFCEILKMKKLLFLIPFVAIISCQTKGEDTKTAPAAVEAEPAAIDISKPDSLIGQPLEKVQAACDAAEVRHRVVEIDGEPQAATRDYRPERLNFSVKDGFITSVTKG